MKKLSLGNEEQIFIRKEVTEGVFNYPTAANLVLATGAASTNQEYEFNDDQQFRPRRSRMSPIRGRLNPGSWSFSTYIKPSGIVGVIPETDVLWECLMGNKTDPVVLGDPIIYTFDSGTNLPSFTMVRKVGHMVLYMAGCTVESGDISITGSDIANVGWSGQFMSWARAGEATLTADTTALGLTVTVDDATRFSVGARINIDTLTNTGLGFLISAINYTTNVITLSEAVGAIKASGLKVTAWYPAGGIEVGTPVHGKLGIVTIDAVPAVLLSSKISIKNNIKYYSDAKNGLMYPTAYGAPSFRDVSGSMQIYFYRNMPGYFYRAEYQIQDALLAPAGNLPGRIFEVSCPRIEYKSPSLSGDAEVMLELPFTAVGSTVGDDECEIRFK